MPPSIVLLNLPSAFLAKVPLGVPSSVDLFGLFPPPGVLRIISNSEERFPTVVAFLFTDGVAVVSGASPGGNGDLEARTLGCSGAFSAVFLGTVPFSSTE